MIPWNCSSAAILWASGGWWVGGAGGFVGVRKVELFPRFRVGLKGSGVFLGFILEASLGCRQFSQGACVFP